MRYKLKVSMGKYILFIAACITMLGSCLNEPMFSEIPRIEGRGMTKTFMNQLSPLEADSTLVTIFFEDGDGDLGGDSLSIFGVDTRTGQNEATFRFAAIPIEGVSSAISGLIRFPIQATCCIYTTGQIPCTPSNPVVEQPVVYEVFIRDRAGNESNRILLDPIILRCQ